VRQPAHQSRPRADVQVGLGFIQQQEPLRQGQRAGRVDLLRLAAR
jgi:hypothetical protein